jgi:hypothetical protein
MDFPNQLHKLPTESLHRTALSHIKFMYVGYSAPYLYCHSRPMSTNGVQLFTIDDNLRLTETHHRQTSAEVGYSAGYGKHHSGLPQT